MQLQKLSLHNFKCFQDIDVDFHPSITVIVGANGAGKTSILEGAAIAISSLFVKMDGPTSQSINKSHAHLKSFSIGSSVDVQPQYPIGVSASAIVDGKRLSWKRGLNSSSGQMLTADAKQIISLGGDYQEQLRQGNTSLRLPIIAYYGTGRLWDYHREKQSDVFEVNNRLNGYIDCVDGTASLKLMMNWFTKMTVQKYQNQDLGLGAIPELEAVFSAMKTCYERITGQENVSIQFNMGTKELDIVFRDETGSIMRMPVSQLSDGYKCTISLVADIAYRMAVLNPQLLENICAETPGIVLIDEVDLHLHPEWQQRILGDLTAIFPKVQFIVTTHAPEVINSISKEHVIVLKNQKTNPTPAQTYGKDANSILRTIMDVESRPFPIRQRITEFYSSVDAKDFVRADEVLTALEAELEDDPELAAMRVQLDFEQI